MNYGDTKGQKKTMPVENQTEIPITDDVYSFILGKVKSQISGYSARKARLSNKSFIPQLLYVVCTVVSPLLVALNLKFPENIVGITALVTSTLAVGSYTWIQIFKHPDRLRIATNTLSKLKAFQTKVEYISSYEANENDSNQLLLEFQAILDESNNGWDKQFLATIQKINKTKAPEIGG